VQVNSDSGACDGGDLDIDASFASTLAGLSADTAYNVNATVLDASVVNDDARHSSPVSCESVPLQVTV